ncbi:unnamed protein product [Eruca vesicaria subsp. sativa]|uniref:Protein BPS1, chloroplastic-like n=1 Tax=Eruca vesicaria subsp. sativa TaxID=29727 RepID=A0ABC8M9U0_ERUVS|nr:unnamed protein product [Eruca vesicaria subsp. sativa]
MNNCGNPFKALFPKKNNAHLLSLLNDFETSLTVSIAQLVPKDNDENGFLTFSWMVHAIHSLCETHQSITTLVTDLDVHVSDMEESMIYMHGDISVKLRQLCTAFNSELCRLNHRNLLLKIACRKPEAFSLSQLDGWRQHMASKNPRIEICGEVLSSLVESMNHHHSLYKKVKKTKENEKEKVLLRALYGAQVETLYIFSVFYAAFTGSSKNLLYLIIPKDMEEVPWGQNRFMVIKDLEAVESGAENFCTAVQEGLVPNLLMVEPLKKSVMELSERVDRVSKEMSCLSDVVSSARDTLFKRLMTKFEDNKKNTIS